MSMVDGVKDLAYQPVTESWLPRLKARLVTEESPPNFSQSHYGLYTQNCTALIAMILYGINSSIPFIS